MSWKQLAKLNLREHTTIYILASLSNILLSTPQYLATYLATLTTLPIDNTTRQFIARYGAGPGIALDLILTGLIFQAILLLLVSTLIASPHSGKGWRWLYISSSLVTSGYVGYWLGAKFVGTLEWVSLLRNNGIDISTVYSDLFWFGLAATICYIAMILVLRRSYGKLVILRDPTS